jgi:hypothetical protein
MRHFLMIGAAAALLVAGAPRAWGDMSKSGKQGFYISQSAIPLTTSFTSVLSGTIPKGLKKRVLEVEATIVQPSSTSAIGITVTVNGHSMEPNVAYVGTTQCMSTADCVATGVFWLDLDTAEAVYPGEFIKQPLVVDMRGTATVATTGNVSLRAHLQKK